MKITIFITACIFACALAEAPSRGYLPPPSGRNGGFGGSGGYGGSGGGSVVEARGGGQGFGGNSFSRSNSFGQGGSAAARFGSNSYGAPAGRSGGGYARSGGDDGFGSNEPAHYNFDYSVSDESGLGGAEFGHHEQREEERAEGGYHVVLPDGRKQIVSYEADESGFKPRISYEDTGRSGGYDSNSQNFGRSSGHDSSFRGGGGY